MWYVFLFMMFCGIMAGYVFMPLSENAKNPVRKKWLGYIANSFILMGVISLLTIFLWIMGWVWYFLGGWLVVECADSFWQYVVNGFISLLPFGLLIGVIMILCGWDPDKK